MRKNAIPLVVGKKDDGTASVLLDGKEIANHLSEEGLRIEYRSAGYTSEPVVTLVFGLGSLDLDLALELAAESERDTHAVRRLCDREV